MTDIRKNTSVGMTSYPTSKGWPVLQNMTKLAVAVAIPRLQHQAWVENRDSQRILEGFFMKIASENTENAQKA